MGEIQNSSVYKIGQSYTTELFYYIDLARAKSEAPVNKFII